MGTDETYYISLQIRHVQEEPESHVGSSRERLTKSGYNQATNIVNVR